MTDTRALIHLPSVEEAMRILLCAEDSDGSLGAVEMRMGAGEAGPPLHRHRLHAESFYVLEGEMTLRIGDARIADGPGLWATAPAGVPHTLANFSAAPARVLCLFSPGGFERRFRRMLASDPERAGLAELAEAEKQTELLGPPMEPPPA
jgi:mannose-6-phosphate isomerase-like protein (cupin superfamily)